MSLRYLVALVASKTCKSLLFTTPCYGFWTRKMIRILLIIVVTLMKWGLSSQIKFIKWQKYRSAGFCFNSSQNGEEVSLSFAAWLFNKESFDTMKKEPWVWTCLLSMTETVLFIFGIDYPRFSLCFDKTLTSRSWQSQQLSRLWIKFCCCCRSSTLWPI